MSEESVIDMRAPLWARNAGFPRSTVISDVLWHFEKAAFPTLFSPRGIWMRENEVQPKKANAPIVVRDCGNVIFWMELQFAKDLNPILVSLDASLNVICSRFVQFSNA